MTPFEICKMKLEQGMIKGEMHTCLRDIGRLAGGYQSARELSPADVAALEDIAAQRSTNPKLGRSTWREAVKYGQAQPLKHDKPVQRATGPAAGFGWDDPIFDGKQKDDGIPFIDGVSVERLEVPEAGPEWQKLDMITYLEAMFTADEKVGIVTGSWEREGKFIPQKGVCNRSRSELVMELQKAQGEYGNVIGDSNPAAGAWVRINPLDGAGVSDINVTDFRHALIEADDQDLGKQLALIRELRLPCTVIVHSGGKSIHAIVRVDATDARDYRERVEKLYRICDKSGLKVDEANRNPSRLSRLPGVVRNGKPQYLIDGKCGEASWDAWVNYIEEYNDKLPNPESLADVWSIPPELAPEVIAGVLRKGHKMLLAGPSKAAKSFDMQELSFAIAHGKQWHGWQCLQGPVLYVNLELDRASCIRRFIAIGNELGLGAVNLHNIDIWNLRGQSVPLDKLAPKLIRRALARNYLAVIIDPIYKVLTGDENSAEEMGAFCNQFDRIALALGSAVVYAHHHSKGAQGGKRSIDRSSGSGVFGRDPDAALDLVELDIPKERREVLYNVEVRKALESFCFHASLDIWDICEDCRVNADAFLMEVQRMHPDRAPDAAMAVFAARSRADSMTGWRIECNLREFATPKPRLTWFRYPIHTDDSDGLLMDAKAAGEEAPWEAERRTKDAIRKEKAEEKKTALQTAIEAGGGPGKVTVQNLVDSMGITDRQVRRVLDASKEFTTKHGIIIKRGDA